MQVVLIITFIIIIINFCNLVDPVAQPYTNIN